MSQRVEVENHRDCSHCGSRETWESTIDEAGNLFPDGKRVILVAEHKACAATLRALGELACRVDTHALRMNRRDEDVGRRLAALETNERSLLQWVERGLSDHKWRLEQLEGSRVVRLVRRCRDVADAIGDVIEAFRGGDERLEYSNTRAVRR